VNVNEQSIELDRSSGEPVIKLGSAAAEFTPDQLRRYASYLTLVADEADKKPEPEVDELVAIFETVPWRLMAPQAAQYALAKAVLAAGYERRAAQAEGGAA
jgi:hypothetical protein